MQQQGIDDFLKSPMYKSYAAQQAAQAMAAAESQAQTQPQTQPLAEPAPTARGNRLQYGGMMGFNPMAMAGMSGMPSGMTGMPSAGMMPPAGMAGMPSAGMTGMPAGMPGMPSSGTSGMGGMNSMMTDPLYAATGYDMKEYQEANAVTKFLTGQLQGPEAAMAMPNLRDYGENILDNPAMMNAVAATMMQYYSKMAQPPHQYSQFAASAGMPTTPSSYTPTTPSSYTPSAPTTRGRAAVEAENKVTHIGRRLLEQVAEDNEEI